MNGRGLFKDEVGLDQLADSLACEGLKQNYSINQHGDTEKRGRDEQRLSLKGVRG
jgi:hypothetical protein